MAWIRLENLVLYNICHWRYRTPAGGPAEAKGHSASNLSLTLSAIWHERQIAGHASLDISAFYYLHNQPLEIK